MPKFNSQRCGTYLQSGHHLRMIAAPWVSVGPLPVLTSPCCRLSTVGMSGGMGDVHDQSDIGLQGIGRSAGLRAIPPPPERWKRHILRQPVSPDDRGSRRSVSATAQVPIRLSKAAQPRGLHEDDRSDPKGSRDPRFGPIEAPRPARNTDVENRFLDAGFPPVCRPLGQVRSDGSNTPGTGPRAREPPRAGPQVMPD